MNKHLLILTLTLLTSCSTSVRKMVTKSAYEPYSQDVSMPFIWAKDSLAGVFYEKTALMIPVKINNIDDLFLMQLDLGSPKTVLYGKTLQALNEQYSQNGITIKQVKKKYFAENVSLYFDQDYIKLNDKTSILQNMGDTILNKESNIIGTLGYDFIKGKIATIDYPNQKILLSDTVPPMQKGICSLRASTKYFPVIITMTVDNIDRNMMFDTGSSLFALITTNKKFNKIEKKENNQIDTLCCVQAWGKDYRFFSKKLKQPIILGKDTLMSQTVFTTERETFKADIGFGIIGIYGITGNVLFWDKKIMINTKIDDFIVFEE